MDRNEPPSSTKALKKRGSKQRICVICASTESCLWRRAADGPGHICNKCGCRRRRANEREKKKQLQSMAAGLSCLQQPPPQFTAPLAAGGQQQEAGGQQQAAGDAAADADTEQQHQRQGDTPTAAEPHLGFPAFYSSGSSELPALAPRPAAAVTPAPAPAAVAAPAAAAAAAAATPGMMCDSCASLAALLGMPPSADTGPLLASLAACLLEQQAHAQAAAQQLQALQQAYGQPHAGLLLQQADRVGAQRQMHLQMHLQMLQGMQRPNNEQGMGAPLPAQQAVLQAAPLAPAAGAATAAPPHARG